MQDQRGGGGSSGHFRFEPSGGGHRRHWRNDLCLTSLASLPRPAGQGLVFNAHHSGKLRPADPAARAARAGGEGRNRTEILYRSEPNTLCFKAYYNLVLQGFKPFHSPFIARLPPLHCSSGEDLGEERGKTSELTHIAFAGKSSRRKEINQK
jgi:hypothetical protein